MKNLLAIVAIIVIAATSAFAAGTMSPTKTLSATVGHPDVSFTINGDETWGPYTYGQTGITDLTHNFTCDIDVATLDLTGFNYAWSMTAETYFTLGSVIDDDNVDVTFILPGSKTSDTPEDFTAILTCDVTWKY
jgi:hypothetical protein